MQSAQPWTRRDTIGVLSVFLAAIVIRLAFVSIVRPVPVSDFLWYFGRAIGIAEGAGFSRGGLATAYFPPGWPYFLAGIVHLFGASPFAAEIMQAVLGALTAALVVVIGRVIAGRAAGIAGGVAYAVLPSAVEWTSVLASEPLYTFLWTLATAIWVTRSTGRIGWYAVSGLVLGAAALVRPSALLFWVILLAYLMTVPSQRRNWRRSLTAVAVTACCTFVVVIPWMVRDYNVYHRLVVISNNGGVSLYQANNALSNAAYTELYNPQIEALLRDPRTEADGDALASQLAIQYMKTHVPREAVLSLFKIKALYSRDDNVLQFSIAKTVPPASERTTRIFFAINETAYYTLMVFALAGIVLCIMNRRHDIRSQWLLVLGMTLYNTLIFSLVGGVDRFRFPTMPYFSVFAGIGLAAALSYILARAGAIKSSTSAKRFAQASPR